MLSFLTSQDEGTLGVSWQAASLCKSGILRGLHLTGWGTGCNLSISDQVWSHLRRVWRDFPQDSAFFCWLGPSDLWARVTPYTTCGCGPATGFKELASDSDVRFPLLTARAPAVWEECNYVMKCSCRLRFLGFELLAWGLARSLWVSRRQWPALSAFTSQLTERRLWG